MRAAAPARRSGDAPYPCPLADAMRRQIDEVAEAPVELLELRPRARRFDGSGRRLARVHSVFRPGRGSGQGKVLPMLRLSGRWLQETGFPIGKRYSVEVEDGALVIRALQTARGWSARAGERVPPGCSASASDRLP